MTSITESPPPLNVDMEPCVSPILQPQKDITSSEASNTTLKIDKEREVFQIFKPLSIQFFYGANTLLFLVSLHEANLKNSKNDIAKAIQRDEVWNIWQYDFTGIT